MDLTITFPDSTKLEFRVEDEDCARLIRRALDFEQINETTSIFFLLRVAFHIYALQSRVSARSTLRQISEAIYDRAGSFRSDDQVVVILC